ncbi:hypothetical protein G7Y89_g713 [Cudoniella acicularis]|uniref:Cytochrome P450 n=1 Tax=Cudoniella acicularis TaxID=354080 RepID=A0A8H4WAY0_9HELO|nr:hypothetical protein G7Y89_g713 [Cudoniella acicularis]
MSMAVPPVGIQVPGTFPSLALNVLVLACVFLLTKILHNLYFHPLSKYPGPKIFAATSLASSYYLFRGTRAYRISELHNRYGPIVRFGPNELSYVNEQAWKDIYGSQKASTGIQLKKKARVTPMSYLSLFPNPSDEAHNRLRKVVAPGFSEKGIRDRETLLQQHVTSLILKLSEKSGNPVDLIWWMDCTASDNLGDMVFGQPFGALETETFPEVLHQADASLKELAFNILYEQYLLGKIWTKIRERFTPRRVNSFFPSFVAENLQKRGKRLAEQGGNGAEVNDINAGTSRGLQPEEIAVVSVDLMIAGADTIITALSLQALSHEIRSTFESESDMTLAALQNLKYLNAVLNESLRLFPAAPETTRRVTNPGGNVICGDLIPTAVGVYYWAAGHNASSWHKVESFIPERWLGDDKFKDDARGVVNHFAVGPRNCVGQTLALAQMRLFVARLIWNFDMELCDESKKWWGMRTFVLTYAKPPLMMKLKPVVRFLFAKTLAFGVLYADLLT